MKKEPEVKLYEISALVCYHAVIAAISEEDAMKHIETLENAWHDNADLVAVSDVELFEERAIKSSIVTDEAHDLTPAARQALMEEDET